MMQEFYKGLGIQRGPTIVFSDSLNVEKSLDYKEFAEQAGFQPTFGIGTFFTSKLLLYTNAILSSYPQMILSTLQMEPNQIR